jgi:hypothetical protein
MLIRASAGNIAINIDNRAVASFSNLTGHSCGLFAGKQKILFQAGCCQELSDRQTQIRHKATQWCMDDVIDSIADDLLCVERIWSYQGSCPLDVSFVFELYTTFEPTFTLIPGVSYQGNWDGQGKEPKGLSYLDEPWTFSYERESLPSASFSENNQFCVGLFASEEAESLQSSCQMTACEEAMIHRLIWPVRETPLVYCNKDSYCEQAIETRHMKPGDQFKVRFYIYAAPVKAKNFGWQGAFDRIMDLDLYQNHHEARFSVREVWDLGIRYLKEHLWVESDAFKGFSIGLLPNGLHMKGFPGAIWRQRPVRRYEIGWAGQNFSNALLLLNDAVRNNNQDSMDKGIACLDHWQRNVCLGNGLFYPLYDPLLDQSQVKAIDTCNLGWGAMQVLNAYAFCHNLGIDKPDWLKMGLDCCDFFCRQWLKIGSFGTWWSPDGKCLDQTTTVGAFMIPAMIQAWRLTKNDTYRRTAIEAFLYYSRDVDRMSCCGGALDTCCIDCETAVSLLEPALDLYEITGQSVFLQKAVNAAYYTLSWVFHYDIKPEPGSDFAHYRFRTSGSSAVSTQHHHLHYGALWFLKGWIRLGHILNDQRWIQRARMVFNASQQLISDGTLTIHGMTRPAGSECEAYHQCNWCLDDNKGQKHYIGDWLVIWPITFRLLNFIGPFADDVMRALDDAKPPDR